jgi:hypothetical protein
MAALAGSAPLTARQFCKPAVGSFLAHLVPPPDCTSAVGVCTAGDVWGGLQGQYNFTMSKMIPSGEPETPAIQFFTGRSVVQTKDGLLYGVDTGTIDLSPAGFASLITWTGGTGAMTGATGQIRLRGQVDFTAGTTSGDYEGTVCVP